MPWSFADGPAESHPDGAPPASMRFAARGRAISGLRDRRP